MGWGVSVRMAHLGLPIGRRQGGARRKSGEYGDAAHRGQVGDRRPAAAAPWWRWGLCVGAGALATYRMYHVDVGGRLRLGDTFPAETDEEAVARVRPQLRPGQGGELWEGGRMAGRFTRDHEFLPGVS